MYTVKTKSFERTVLGWLVSIRRGKCGMGRRYSGTEAGDGAICMDKGGGGSFFSVLMILLVAIVDTWGYRGRCVIGCAGVDWLSNLRHHAHSEKVHLHRHKISKTKRLISSNSLYTSHH